MNVSTSPKVSYPTEQELAARVESLRESAPNSTALVDAILAYVETKWFEPDVSVPLIEEALGICERIDYRLGKAKTQVVQAEATYIQTRYQESLPLVADAIPVLIEHDANKEYCWTLLLLSAVSQATGAYDSALEHGFKALDMANEFGVSEVSAWMNYRISDIYRELGDHDNMLEFAQACYDKFEELYDLTHRRQHMIGTARARTQLAMAKEVTGDLGGALALNQAALERYRDCGDGLGETRAVTDIGRIHSKLGELDKAERFLKEGLEQRRRLGHLASQTSNLLALGELYMTKGETDKAIEALESALDIATDANVKMRAYQAHEALSRIYEKTDRPEQAFEHYRRFHEIKEEVAGEAMHLRIHNTKVLGEIARAEKKAEIERAKNDELKAKNDELARLLKELKATQDKLVHSEKMASLGQLTAGIAHEIRNPLNFVNNFSELSAEIVDEMRQALDACSNRLPEKEREEMLDSLETLIFNSNKIREHGARADSIVRSMLQHSRKGEGEPEPVDLNKLIEEYLNLAYHGMRARTSDFNVVLNQDYDDDVGEVMCVGQDIGRVLLNLFSNAFEALHEADRGHPAVSVSTRRLDGKVEISVSDNGPGMPEKVRSKIFEPFFTTKAAGSGTGLGLSMSYDIVTKGHGGEFEVISEEGNGATFVIRLPG